MNNMTKVKNTPTENQTDVNVAEQAQPETQQPETQQPETQTHSPVFEEIEGMDQNTALSVLIQTGELAQKAGVLTMRDSVVLAKAISLFAPNKV